MAKSPLATPPLLPRPFLAPLLFSSSRCMIRDRRRFEWHSPLLTDEYKPRFHDKRCSLFSWADLYEIPLSFRGFRNARVEQAFCSPFARSLHFTSRHSFNSHFFCRIGWICSKPRSPSLKSLTLASRQAPRSLQKALPLLDI